jgi:hypothetical protein
MQYLLGEKQIVDLMIMAIKFSRMENESKTISQRQAHKIYGRSNVERWVKEGSVREIKLGEGRNCKVYIDRQQIEIAYNAMIFVSPAKRIPTKTR